MALRRTSGSGWQIQDLAGKDFGRLHVEELHSSEIQPAGREVYYWRCRCVCGEEIIVQGRRLTQGPNPVASCGCEAWEPLPLPETTVAYLAALIDGEGCLSLSKDKREGKFGCRYNPCLSIGMTGEALVALWQEIGVGSLHRKPAQHEGYKPSCVWQLAPGALRHLLPQVLPFLRFKRKQAELLIEYLQLSQHIARSDKERLEAHMVCSEAIYQRIRFLNKRGV